MGSYLLQPNRYSCGTLSVLNAIMSLGGESTYEDVYAAIGTTSRDGTSDDGILSGLSLLGYRGWEYKGKNPDCAWRYVSENCGKTPVILLVDDWKHWIVATSKASRKVVVIDSDPNTRKNEAGAIVYDKQSLLSRWKYRGGYYAIRVTLR